MTYSIFSIDSGSVLESYGTPEGAFDAAARMFESEPEAADSVAVVAFDDCGIAVEKVEGLELIARVREATHA